MANVAERISLFVEVLNAVKAKNDILGIQSALLGAFSSTSKRPVDVFKNLITQLEVTKQISKSAANEIRANISSIFNRTTLFDKKEIAAEILSLDRVKEKIIDIQASLNSFRAIASRSFKSDLTLDLTKDRPYIPEEGFKDIKTPASLSQKLMLSKEYVKILREEYEAIDKGNLSLKQRETLLNSLGDKASQIQGYYTEAASKQHPEMAGKEELLPGVENLRKDTRGLTTYADEGLKSVKVIKEQSKATVELNKEKEKLNNNLTIAVGKLIRYRVAFYAMRGAIEGFRESIKVFTDLEYQLAQLHKVLPADVKDVENFKRAVFDLGKGFGVSAIEVAQSMTVWAQMGLRQNEIIEMTKVTLMGANAMAMTATEVTEALTAAIYTYGIAMEDTADVIAKWMAVQAKYPTTAQDLANSLKVVGSAGRVVGVELEDLAGYVTAINAATRKSGVAVGQSVKTMFARLPRKEVIEVFESLGIAVLKNASEFRDLDDILDDLSSKWDNLSSVQKANLSIQISGVRRYSDFIALMDNWEMKQSAVITAQQASSEALRANQIELNTTKKSWDSFNVTLDQFQNTVGATVLVPLTALMQAGGKFLEFANSGSGVIGKLVGAFATFIGVASTLAITIIGAEFALNLVLKPMNAFKAQLMETAVALGVCEKETVTYAIAVKALSTEQIKAVIAQNTFLVGLSGVTGVGGIPKAVARVTTLTGVISKLNVWFLIIGTIVTAAIAIYSLFGNRIKGVTKEIDLNIDSETKRYKTIQQSIDAINNQNASMESNAEKLKSLKKELFETNESTQRYVELLNRFDRVSAAIAGSNRKLLDITLDIRNATSENVSANKSLTSTYKDLDEAIRSKVGANQLEIEALEKVKQANVEVMQTELAKANLALTNLKNQQDAAGKKLIELTQKSKISLKEKTSGKPKDNLSASFVDNIDIGFIKRILVSRLNEIRGIYIDYLKEQQEIINKNAPDFSEVVKAELETINLDQSFKTINTELLKFFDTTKDTIPIDLLKNGMSEIERIINKIDLATGINKQGLAFDAMSKKVETNQGVLLDYQRAMQNILFPKKPVDFKSIIGVGQPEDLKKITKEIKDTGDELNNLSNKYKNLIDLQKFGEGTISPIQFNADESRQSLEAIEKLKDELDGMRNTAKDENKIIRDLLKSFEDIKKEKGLETQLTLLKEMSEDTKVSTENVFKAAFGLTKLKDSELLIATKNLGIQELVRDNIEDIGGALTKRLAQNEIILQQTGAESVLVRLMLIYRNKIIEYQQVYNSLLKQQKTIELGVQKYYSERIENLKTAQYELSKYKDKEMEIQKIAQQIVEEEYQMGLALLASVPQEQQLEKRAELTKQHFEDSVKVLREMSQVKMNKLTDALNKGIEVFNRSISDSFSAIPDQIVEVANKRKGLSRDLKEAEIDLQRAREEGDQEAILNAQDRVQYVKDELHYYRTFTTLVKSTGLTMLKTVSDAYWKNLSENFAKKIGDIKIGGETISENFASTFAKVTGDAISQFATTTKQLNNDFMSSYKKLNDEFIYKLAKIYGIKPEEVEKYVNSTLKLSTSKLPDFLVHGAPNIEDWENILDGGIKDGSKTLKDTLKTSFQMGATIISAAISNSIFPGNQGAMAGSGVGSMFGAAMLPEIIGKKGMASMGAVLGSIIPGLGTILGGLLGAGIGSLFGGGEPEEPFDHQIKAINDNTDALARNTLALEQLDKAIFNAPTRYNIPAFSGGFGNVSISVYGGNGDSNTIANKVVSIIENKYLERSKQYGTRGYGI